MRRITVLFLAVVLIVTLAAGTAMAKPGKSKGKERGILCREGTTITVARPAEKAHLKHGGTPGACAAPAPIT